MAHLFSDDTKASYDANLGKFVDNPLTTYTPKTWVDDAEFIEQVDLSVPGMMQDCAECHVGGGPMEYVPNNDPTARSPLRTYATDYPGANPTAFNRLVDTFDADENGTKYEVLTVDYASTGVMEMDCLLCHMKGYDYIARRDTLRQAKFDAAPAVGAGVATRTITNTDANWGDANWSNVRYDANLVENDGAGNLKLNYYIIDALKTQPPSRNCGFCHFDQDLDDDPTTGYEGSDNHGSVDWKKRGDAWMGDVNHDVHTVLGCMGCHEAKAGTNIDTSGLASSSYLGQCDPAKGIAPFSSVWGKTDGSIKTCADCHLRAGLLQIAVDDINNVTGLPPADGKQDLAPVDEIDNVTGLAPADGLQDLMPVDVLDNTTGLPNVDTNDPNYPGDGIQDEVGGVLAWGDPVWGDPVFITSDVGDYGAPDPTAKHQQYGLTAVIASTTNDGGDPNASHLDILDCGACHVGKVSTDAWNNGGCVVDATGGDLFDRLADHENEYVQRSMFIDTTTFGALDGVADSPNITFSWLKGKIIATSALTTLYYRGKNDADHDLNSDGMMGGMDAILMTHLMKANEDNPQFGGVNIALTELDHGVLSDANVGTQIAYLNANMPAINGGGGTPNVKLSAMSVPFKVQHNIAPVSQYVLGKACADCHSATGMLARDYNLVPDNMTFSVTGAVSTPLTKANGTDADVTTFHPNLKDRKGGRSIARNYTATGGLGTIQVSEMLYEDDFKTRVGFSTAAIDTGALGAVGGNFLRLELTDGVTSWKRNIKMPAGITGSAAALTAMGSTFGNFDTDDDDILDTIEFTVADLGTALRFTPFTTGLSIRFDSLTGAAFGVVDQVFDDTYTITGVDGLTYDGHNDWVTYLTGSFDPTDYGVGVVLTASITGLPATVEVGTAVALTAGASAAANSQYFWTVNDMSEATLLGDADPLNDTDPHDPAAGQTSSWTFNYPGTWKVLLTVVAPDGQLAQQMGEIQVVRDLADTQYSLSGISAGNPTVTINLSAIPTHDELYFFFGDGTRLSVSDSGGSYSMVRDYRLRDTFLHGTNYEYTTSVQVKNAGAIVEVINIPVVIPQ